MMRTMVTGGAGFIGSRLMEFLDDAFSWDLQHNQDIHVTPKDLDGAKAIVHLAAISGIKDCEQDRDGAFDTNIEGTYRLLEEATINGVKRFVFASSMAVGNGSSFYALSKQIGETFCFLYSKKYGVNAAILRLGNVYGPGSDRKKSVVANMCRQALTTKEILVHGDGTQARHFVHVDDVCRAITRSLIDSDALVMNVCNQYAAPIIEIANLISKLSGAKIILRQDINPGVKFPDISYDDSRFSTLMPLEQGIVETWEWFKEKYR